MQYCVQRPQQKQQLKKLRFNILSHKQLSLSFSLLLFFTPSIQIVLLVWLWILETGTYMDSQKARQYWQVNMHHWVSLHPTAVLYGKYTILVFLAGEGNGTLLQYTCLENPMDGGDWWAAVHGVDRSRTRLSDFTFTFHFHALEKEMATHSSVLAWRIPGTGEPGVLPSLRSQSQTRLKWLSIA